MLKILSALILFILPLFGCGSSSKVFNTAPESRFLPKNVSAAELGLSKNISTSFSAQRSLKGLPLNSYIIFTTVDSLYGEILWIAFHNFEIKIISDPPGAKIIFENKDIGTAPLAHKLNGVFSIWYSWFTITALSPNNDNHIREKVIVLQSLDSQFPDSIYFNFMNPEEIIRHEVDINNLSGHQIDGF